MLKQNGTNSNVIGSFSWWRPSLATLFRSGFSPAFHSRWWIESWIIDLYILPHVLPMAIQQKEEMNGNDLPIFAVCVSINGGFHQWGYPCSSSILDWDFPIKTIQLLGYPHCWNPSQPLKSTKQPRPWRAQRLRVSPAKPWKDKEEPHSRVPSGKVT